MLRLRTFGGLALTSDSCEGRALTGAATQRRPLALLAVLAVAGEPGISRDRLQTLLWPESDEARARRVLAQTLYALRRDLGDVAAILGTVVLRLNSSVITVDVTELEHAAAVGELERVVTLYRGPLLDGIHLPDAPEFEHWLTVERERLSVVTRKSLEQLARDASTRGDAEVAVGWWRRLAALDPTSGRVAVGLMEALAASGDPAGALRHARLHEILLREELGVGPDAAVTRLAERLRGPGAPRPPTAPPALPLVPATPVTTLAPALLPTMPPSKSDHDGPSMTEGKMPAVAGTPPVMTAAARSDSTADVAPPKDPSARHRRRRRTRLWVAVTAAMAAVAILAPLLRSRRGTASPLKRQLLVVVPFDIADPELRLWREGMVDVLSRNLDGAGPLRTVSPTRVVREWKGRADHEAAQAFARTTGAHAVLFGQLLRAGPDSVRATATLLSASTGEPIAEFRRQDANERMDRLTDSMTVDILRAIGATMPLASARDAPLRVGPSSARALTLPTPR